MFKEKIVPLKPKKAIIVQSDVINKIKQIEENDDIVLIKASNGMHFEEIVDAII